MAIGALALLRVGSCAAQLRAPSQEDHEEHFRSNRPALEALVQLINEDRQDGFCLRGAGLKEMRQRISAERLTEYRTRLKEANVQCVWRSDNGRVLITKWAFGLPGTQTARGYVWSRGSLPNEFPCIDSLTCFPQGFKRQRREAVHVRIDPEWAIYAF